MPQYEEQKKIADFLTLLDSKISNLSNFLIELKEYNIKSSDLQNELLRYLVDEYFHCFERLKKIEIAIYKQEVKNE